MFIFKANKSFFKRSKITLKYVEIIITVEEEEEISSFLV